jgi:hypothetical protein
LLSLAFSLPLSLPPFAFNLFEESPKRRNTEREERKRTMSLRPSLWKELRRKSYKSSVDGDEARRRREDNLLEIKKSKREDSLLKKKREWILLLVSATELTPICQCFWDPKNGFHFTLFLHSISMELPGYVFCVTVQWTFLF